MNILITGAKGFIGKNLTENLKNIRDKKNCTRPNLQIENIYEYDLDSTPEELETYCKEADFIFNLAGVNRPKDPEEFKEGNVSFSSALLDTLEKCGSRATVMLSSSVQASLQGRFGISEYGLSKKAGEDLFFAYGEKNNVRVLVYRFPNLPANGFAQTITARSALFVIILPTSCRLQFIIRLLNLKFFLLMISLRKCLMHLKKKSIIVNSTV